MNVKVEDVRKCLRDAVMVLVGKGDMWDRYMEAVEGGGINPIKGVVALKQVRGFEGEDIPEELREEIRALLDAIKAPYQESEEVAEKLAKKIVSVYEKSILS